MKRRWGSLRAWRRARRSAREGRMQHCIPFTQYNTAYRENATLHSLHAIQHCVKGEYNTAFTRLRATLRYPLGPLFHIDIRTRDLVSTLTRRRAASAGSAADSMRRLSPVAYIVAAQQSGPLSPSACITPSFSSFFQTVMLPWSRSSSIPMRSPCSVSQSCGCVG